MDLIITSNTFQVNPIIFWFNPNIVQMWKLRFVKFLWHLLISIFPCHHKYYKLFNRHYIKLSYSHIPSVNSIIWKHKTDCCMDGHCLSECLIYKTCFNATISKYYCGTYENNFKENSNNQTGFFRNKSREKNTELCK